MRSQPYPPRTRAAVVALLSLATFPVAADLMITKTVDNPTPQANEPVEFTVEAINDGLTGLDDVLVIDKLPPGLAIPVGMGAFPSAGYYDPDTGEWWIGRLEAGHRVILVVPALVTAAAVPDCTVNTAIASHPAAWYEDNNTASVALRGTGVERCVDLAVQVAISHYAGVFNPRCDSEQTYGGRVWLTNRGPDVARDVVVTLKQHPVIGPNLRFEDSACDNPPGPSCWIGALASGTKELKVTSDLYRLYESVEQTISVAVTTSDTDYELADNHATETYVAFPFSGCGLTGLVEAVDDACLIATAAYGSPLHPHVGALRQFRDRVLLKHAWGRALVGFYYRHSAPIAAYIAPRPRLRTVVRAILVPVVLAIEHPLSMLALAGLLLAGTRLGPWHSRRSGDCKLEGDPS
jgi:uncharacterized repeat protein (TIGR01451 family)